LTKFQEHDKIRVRKENPLSPIRRTPEYIRGKVGIVDRCYGTVVEADFDYDHRISWGPLYTIVFEWSEVHKDEEYQNSRFFVDLHESWLEPA
jgi:hypothetical protein